MTEHEWLTGTDPRQMFDHLRGPARPRQSRWFRYAGVSSAVNARKSRLYALALLRHFQEARWRDSPQFRLALDRAERWADGGSDEPPEGLVELLLGAAGGSGLGTTVASVVGPLLRADFFTDTLVLSLLLTLNGHEPILCDLLREVFGNPFRPVVVQPGWLAWNDGTAARLARTIHDERRFTDLPVLADALEEAGCDSPELLGHCRSAAGHVPGCWALDLLLQNE